MDARRRRVALILLTVLAALLLGACQGPAVTTEASAPLPHAVPEPGTVVSEPTDRHPARGTPTREAWLPQAFQPSPRVGASNVVMILTDDMRWDELKYLTKTRELLVDQGMNFPEAISPHPLCCPARATLMTGEYAQNNGVLDNAGPMGRYQAYVRGGGLDNSIGPWFTKAGYNTAFVGKHINKYEDEPGPPRNPGWTYWNPLTWGVIRYSDFSFYDGTTYRDDYVTNRVEQKAEEALDHLVADGRPFYLQVNHIAPHFRRVQGRDLPPLVEETYARSLSTVRSPSLSSPAFNADRPDAPSKKVSKKLVKREFHARIRALQSVDNAVASLIAKLDAAGVLNQTYLVFTSDNGYDLGEFRHIGKNRLNNVDMRVPLVIRGPGVLPATASNKPVSTVDVAATVISLVGATPTREPDGIDIRPLLAGQPQRWRDATLIQTGQRHRNKRGNYWRTRGVLTSRYLYARDYQKPNQSILYDHRRDPHELDNVVDDPRYVRVRKRLDQILRKLARCNGVDSCNRDFGPVPAPRR